MTTSLKRIQFEDLLRRMGGDRSLAITVLDSFAEDVPGRLQNMAGELAAGRQEAARKMAHTLKGAAATSGAEFVQLRAVEFEKALKCGSTNEIWKALGNLRREVALVLEATRTLKQKNHDG